MSSTPATEEAWIGHPRGLFVLFATEMWERFSYYGMRALLILYLTKHFLFGDKTAGLIFGSYASLVYAMPVLGGLIADRYLGFKKAIMFGAVLLCCGHFGMAFEGPPASVVDGEVVRASLHEQVFYLSLAFIVVGVGFLKASISSIVGQLYRQDDPRRDAGFTIFYMGINLGAFVATLLCAYLGETYGWRYGFGLAGIGMLIGLVTFIRGGRYLTGIGEPPVPEALTAKLFTGLSREGAIYLGGLASVLLVWQLIQRTGELGLLLTGFGLVVVTWVIWFSLSQCTPAERNRMLVMLLLIVLSVFFWALFEQAGSSLTLFTDRNVAMGDIFTAGMFQSLNPLFIIMFAPLFAWLWVKLSARNREPSTPMKFGLGIVQVGLGFAVLLVGAAFAGEDGKVAVVWLALMYLLHTTGELCLSPVGLSMVTKLSVARVGGMMMGVWFLSSSFAAYVAGMIAGAMAIGESGADVAIGAESLAVYTSVFGKLAWLAVGLGVGLMVIAPWLAGKMKMEDEKMKGPLSGFRIVDLSSVISGPVATVLLADQGADVIKVEAPAGDIVRRMGRGHDSLSPAFVTANRGKRSVCINLKEARGVEIVKRLIADADVFIQNFRPGAIEKMGLGYDVLTAINPALLYVSVSGFGEKGPYSHKRVYDPVIQALTGLPDTQADSADARPKMVRTIIPDKVSALTTAQAITAGLLERERGDGKGQHIRVAMVDATISFLWPEALGGLTMVGQEQHVRRGQLAQDLVFETKDGFIACGAVSDSEWEGMCAALDRPDWLDDERFNTPLGRVQNAKERLEGMADVLKSRTSAAWLERLDAHDVPCAPILSRPEILENEQIKANELIHQYDHPGLGQIRQPRPGARFSRSHIHSQAVAPTLGEHSQEVLTEAGLAHDEIEELLKDGVIVQRSND